MYIQEFKRKNKDKVSISTNLVRSYREDGKQKREILANLSKLPKQLIEIMKSYLKGNNIVDLEELGNKQGKSCGALITFNKILQQLYISEALGNDKNALLAIVQILARIITQRSRLHISKEWFNTHALEELLGFSSISEDSLYRNLEWLSDNQERIEDRLFAKRTNKEIKEMFLYDVTSSYFEGTLNELAAYGYNRDGKKGKKQIVVGLLCDNEGDPISIEVFEGNSCDTSTVTSQLNKLKQRFGCERMVLVGDKGMIKSAQIDEISDLKYNYITSITKQQIETLLKEQIIDYELFDKEIVEVENENIRYILRRNPIRANEIEENRNSKIGLIETLLTKKNLYLKEHPRAKCQISSQHITDKIKSLKLSNICNINIDQEKRQLSLNINQKTLKEAKKLDGCYIIKTDLKKETLSAKEVHDRYKDLSKVEDAFRTIKTGIEEIRPIFLRKEKRTRGHVFVCMLAYKAIRHFWQKIKHIPEITKQGAIISLDMISYSSYTIANETIKIIPKELLPQNQLILNELNIKLPRNL